MRPGRACSIHVRSFTIRKKMGKKTITQIDSTPPILRDLVRKLYKFAGDLDEIKATFCSPSEVWCLPAPSSITLQEREFDVDSGASMHVMSRKDLNSADLVTVRVSRNRTKVCTGKLGSTHERGSDFVCQRFGSIRDRTARRGFAASSITWAALHNPRETLVAPATTKVHVVKSHALFSLATKSPTRNCGKKFRKVFSEDMALLLEVFWTPCKSFSQEFARVHHVIVGTLPSTRMTNQKKAAVMARSCLFCPQTKIVSRKKSKRDGKTRERLIYAACQTAW